MIQDCAHLNIQFGESCQFLSDPSPIIGNACQWLTHSPDSCLVNLIDVTLECEDAYSKLEVVTVAGVGDG